MPLFSEKKFHQLCLDGIVNLHYHTTKILFRILVEGFQNWGIIWIFKYIPQFWTLYLGYSLCTSFFPRVHIIKSLSTYSHTPDPRLMDDISVYICTLFDFHRKRILYNHHRTYIFASHLEPFSVIIHGKCKRDKQNRICFINLY